VSSDDDRQRAIELLEANHVFPGDYGLSVVAVNTDAVMASVLAATREETGELAPLTHETRPSSGGKYVSHRLTVRCVDAAQVLRLYARLRSVDGVITVL
jgi:putative lipoic acid-binding regulatory protein